jgi:hypothetical protein
MTSPNDVPALLELLREGNQHLVNMTKSLDFPWDPTTVPDGNPRRLHNMYARSLITCYVSKVADLSDGILDAVERSHFLVYALCGRALIETTATLWYYVTTQYKPLLDRGALDGEAMRTLIDIDDRHLRGTRFDWESFLLFNYTKLKADEIVALDAKRKNKKSSDKSPPDALPRQVNVSTCIEKWAAESPGVSVAYNLFCDLVHPNIGSTFLVASTSSRGLYFSRSRGESVGRQIFEQSLSILLATAHKPFGPLLLMLMGTIWQDDEL